jgi:hypothetical protein
MSFRIHRDPPMNTPNEKRLVDEAMDAYVDWREACVAVSDAYQRWAQACSEDAGLAFGGYRAALDREERASRVYASLVTQIATDRPPVFGPDPRAVPR